MFSIMRDSVTLFGMVTTPRCICHLQTKWTYNNYLSLIKIKHIFTNVHSVVLHTKTHNGKTH